MPSILSQLIHMPITGLFLKEVRLTLRNSHLLFLLIFPPIIQLIILGYSLDPKVHNLHLAIVDLADTPESRTLIRFVTSDKDVFVPCVLPPQPKLLVKELLTDRCGAGMIIPSDFSQQLLRTHKGEFQVILNGVDAFTSKLARGYIQLLAAHAVAGQQNAAGIVRPQVRVAFNPGLVSAWYFVPGVLGALITLSGTLVSSAAMLRERESGTLEQLMVLPVSSAEIVIAKAVPLFVLLFIDLCIAIALTTWLFALPFRGNVFLFLFCSALYILVSIGMGTLMATFCSRQRQAQLLSFFINIPLILLSGSVVPLETMPKVLQAISLADPLRYYQILSRNIILKGLGPLGLSTDILCLFGFCLLLLIVNLMRFRHQLR